MGQTSFCGVGRCKALEGIGILFLKFKCNNLSVPEKPSSIQDELFDTVPLYLRNYFEELFDTVPFSKKGKMKMKELKKGQLVFSQHLKQL